MVNENFVTTSDFLDGFIPKSKADEHFIKAVQLMQSELYQSAVVEFHHACQLNSAEILPLAKKLYEEKVTRLEYGSSLALGLLLLSIDQDNYAMATDLAEYARKCGNLTQALSLYKKALTIEPSYMPALCNLGALKEDLPYDTMQSIGAYKFFLNINHLFPPFIVLDDNDVMTYDDDFIKNIAPKVSQYILNARIDKESYDKSLGQKMGLSKEMQKELIQEDSNPIKKKKNQDLKTSEYIQYLEWLAKNDPSKKHVYDFNIILLLLKDNFDLKAAKKRLDNLAKDFENLQKKLPNLDIVFGLYYMINKQLQEASKLFIGIISKDRYNRYANANLGLTLRAANNLQQAARYLILAYYLYEKSCNNFNIEVLKKHAQNKYQARLFKDAKTAFLILIDENHATIKDYRDCVECLLQENKLEEAKKLVDKCSAIFKNSEEVKDLLTDFCEKVLKVADEYSYEKGNERRSFLIYKLAFSLDQRISTIRKMLDVMSNFKLNNEEIEFKNFIQQELHAKLAEQNFTKQREEVENRKKLLEKQWSVYIRDAKIFASKGNYAKSMISVEAAFRLKSDSYTYNLLANLYQMLGKTEELKILSEKYERIQSYETGKKINSKNK